MSVDDDARKIAECSHGLAIPFGTRSVMRCPYCGAMQVGQGPWALPHYVDQLVQAWKKTRVGPS